MLGNRALSILSQENYPVEDKPTIINYRQPSEVDEDIEDDYGIVGYMGEDEDIEQAKYDVMSMLSDQFTGFDNRIESMKQQLEDINSKITNQSSVIQDIQGEILSESSVIQDIQGEIYSESSAIQDIQGEIRSESSIIQYDINAENDRIRGLQREIHSESSIIQGEIYSESSRIHEDMITILERYSRGQVCSPPCPSEHKCF
jgi:chromosome segregation ATPase